MKGADSAVTYDRCVAITRSGTQCRMVSQLNELGLCWLHDPERANPMHAKTAATKAAGPKVRRPVTIRTLEDARAARGWLYSALATDEIDRDKAKILIGIIDSQERALRDDELRHLKELAERLASGSSESTPGRG